MSILIFLGALLGSMAIGVPIAFALLLTGAALMGHLGLFETQILAQKVVDGADSYPLMAVPFFLLAGELMTVGGLTKRIVAAANALFGHIRGGLGYVVIGTGVLLASLSGSAIADTAALAVMLLPLMRQAGYSESRSCGLIAATGIIAPIIPPSIGFVLFGVTTNTSITKLFFAGIIPGLAMGLSLVVIWWWLCRNNREALPPRKRLGEMAIAVGNAGWALGMPLIIIGGLKLGLFTPTEAAIVAAMYSLLVSVLVYRELPPRVLYKALLSAARTSAVIMFIVAASMVSAWMITVANIPDEVVKLLMPFFDRPMLLMAMIMALVFSIGMVLDFTPSILIIAPVLMPVVHAAGIDPVYFGVLYVMNAAIGMLTPPVGVVLNVVCGVAKVRMEEAISGVIPFLVAETVAMALLIVFPTLVTTPVKWFF